MLESGEQATIDIEAIVSCKSSSNTLEITLKRDKEVLLERQHDGSVDTLGSNIAAPFPIPHILLKDIVSFEPHNINPLLQLDPVLCDHLSVKIASKAAEEQVPGPLYISLHVTVTPHRFLFLEDEPELDEEMEIETCAICLEELNPKGEIYFDLPNCSHQFHDLCIYMWLSRSNSCPLCRTVAEDDEFKPIVPSELYRNVRDSQLIGMSGYTREGLPIFAIGVGLSTFDKASVHYYVQSHIHNEYRDRPSMSKKNGRPITTCVKLVTIISTIDDLNYPEKTNTYYVVNAPYIYFMHVGSERPYQRPAHAGAPQQRLGFKRGATEVKQHPVFEGVNWALIRCATPLEIPNPVKLESGPVNVNVCRGTIKPEDSSRFGS
ncbi:unnamed protein product [Eruca vesicaria subsp. sativa]|uniref:RING-type domain-containing protein n=1 Tax=Eruca vesicaria subsp. sativa TaxID=29727 RepID=A0ABC8LXT6_ERUVS|nr:unnamed protein product [Eruca vesicaria subsp. sativa]